MRVRACVRTQVYLAYSYITYKDIEAEPLNAVCLYLVRPSHLNSRGDRLRPLAACRVPSAAYCALRRSSSGRL